MAYEILWEPRATNAAVRFLKDDPAGLAAVYEAVQALAEQPCPRGSFPLGTTGIRRLRVGAYRVLYVIKEETIRILVTSLGRTPD
ncbi:type II toxin-antitoxin system RelE/ParE family toxin [Streptomyces albus subsp. chlorinus]|uniref:type II toxin-antitoxin system RelE/ParE family toxin n=1 Tax=Streptomyces albus TaxID=1888 RepID=UPI00156DBD08|nr:type II toxin-antitoxin system RelE/ParE family toxin [Streptomyces albus subsp. chlorinus]